MSEHSILCVASRPEQLQRILDALLAGPFADCEISVVYPRVDTPSLPGLEPLLEAGSIVAALREPGSRESGEAVVEMLVELGLSAEKADRAARHVKDGRIVISVRCDVAGSVDGVREIFRAAGARVFDGEGGRAGGA